MYQHKPRRFKRRTDGRSHQLRGNGSLQIRLGSNSFSNNPTRNHFRPPQSAEKLFEKYNTLAKEALSTGDKTLSENYFQHADHFMRIIEDKSSNQNQNQNQNRVQADIKSTVSDKPSIENSSVNQNKIIEEKKVKKE